MAKTLKQMLEALPPACILRVQGEVNTGITAPVTEQASAVVPGGIFVARQGMQADGHEFIAQAIQRGAVALFGEREMLGLPIPYIQLNKTQPQLGVLAAAYHDFPARRLRLIGISGTDGKTTVTHLAYSILELRMKGRVGLVSTLKAICGSEERQTGLHVTSPPAPQLQGYLAEMVANGMTHAVLEMTSHGLAQGRLQGVSLAMALLTNIQHEHLDYHRSWEAYRAAKGRIFDYLTVAPSLRVLNAEDEKSQVFAEEPMMTFGCVEAADFRVQRLRESGDGIQYVLSTALGKIDIQSPLAGTYNAINGAAAATVTAPLINYDLNTIQQGIANLRYLPGRMEVIDESQDFLAIVDFAHTPAALRASLLSAKRRLQEGQRLCAVFGSAGLRDRMKRKMMAEIGIELADFVVLTAEDPRTESLADILQDMAQACRAVGGQEGVDFVRIPDRGIALHRACCWARAGDIVLACGKGHEQSMCFGKTEYPWDDRVAMRAALRDQPLKTLPTATSEGMMGFDEIR